MDCVSSTCGIIFGLHVDLFSSAYVVLFRMQVDYVPCGCGCFPLYMRDFFPSAGVFRFVYSWSFFPSADVFVSPVGRFLPYI